MTDSFFQKLKTGLAKFEVDIDRQTAEKLNRYAELLVEWNEKINLTAITDEDGIVYKHFVDSLTVYPLLTELNKGENGASENGAGFSLIDVGTGAGFPGIPLAIIDSRIQVTLLDSLAKRVNFLQTVISELKLENVCAVHSRAEDGAACADKSSGKKINTGSEKILRENFDIAIARAVAAMPVLAEYSVPFVKKGGYFVAMKGGNAEEEMKSAANAIKTLGCSKANIKRFSIEEIDSERSLIYAKKVSGTPLRFPRKAGTPTKKPL